MSTLEMRTDDRIRKSPPLQNPQGWGTRGLFILLLLTLQKRMKAITFLTQQKGELV
jgi:hypothetical protein